MHSSDPPREKKQLILVDRNEIKSLKKNPFIIKSIHLFEKEIEINVSYTGGCKTHEFQLVVDKNLKMRQGKDIDLNLRHNDNGDRCKRIVNERLIFDLSPLLQLIQIPNAISDVKLFVEGKKIELDAGHKE